VNRRLKKKGDDFHLEMAKPRQRENEGKKQSIEDGSKAIPSGTRRRGFNPDDAKRPQRHRAKQKGVTKAETNGRDSYWNVRITTVEEKPLGGSPRQVQSGQQGPLFRARGSLGGGGSAYSEGEPNRAKGDAHQGIPISGSLSTSLSGRPWESVTVPPK